LGQRRFECDYDPLVRYAMKMMTKRRLLQRYLEADISDAALEDLAPSPILLLGVRGVRVDVAINEPNNRAVAWIVWNFRWPRSVGLDMDAS
jgi:hypothetical protein